MKKFVSVLMVLILMCAFTFNVSAEQFEKMKDLNNYWDSNDAYPDWFCGIWTETGSLDNLIVAVLDTEEGNNGKLEILDLIEDDLSVSFTYGEYSRNYLINIQHSLFTDEMRELGLSYSAFLDDKSRLEIGILKSFKDNPETMNKLEELKEEYGDIFIVKYTEGVALEESLIYTADIPSIANTIITVAESKPDYIVYVAVFVSVLLSLTCLIFVLKYQRKLMLVTATGETVDAYVKLTTKEVERLIESAEADLPSDLEEKVMKKIDSI